MFRTERTLEEALHRDVNDRIAEVGGHLDGGADALDFFCECSINCLERVALTIAEYADLRERGLIRVPGHGITSRRS